MAQNKYEKKSVNKPLAKLFQFLAPEKNKIIFSIFLSLIGAACTLAAPLVLKEVSTLILNYSPTTTDPTAYANGLMKWALIAVGCYAGGFIFNYWGTYIVAGVCAVGSHRLRNEMIKKINRMPLNYFDTRNIGDVLSYISNDVDVVGTTLNQSLSNLIGAIMLLIGSLVILFVLEWRLGLTALIILPIGLFILLKVGGASQKHFIAKQTITSQANSFAEESYTGFNIIRVMRATDAKRDAFADVNHKLEKTTSKADYYASIMTPLMVFFGNLLFSCIALVGGAVACRVDSSIRAETIATVVAAVSYAENLTQPLSQIANTFATLQQTIAAATRIFTFLAEEEQVDESEKTVTIPDVQGNIAFDHVKFGYNKDRVIIHDFSEVGKHGQKIAIVGPTGAGKTTMVNLLMRFYEINSGKITIEGIDTKTMKREYVRGLFGMVLQDTWLFEGTIMENLKFSRPSATDEEVYEACKATHCDTFILQQEGGYNHILNEDCGLSSGQKQLLTIARAMIQNAPMLILDEATSSVDTRTEAQIQDAMDKLMKGRTSFVIAHRLSTIKNSDLIIVMKDGDVIETGNHDQLMKKKGFYAGLYNAQFTGEGEQFS